MNITEYQTKYPEYDIDINEQSDIKVFKWVETENPYDPDCHLYWEIVGGVLIFEYKNDFYAEDLQELKDIISVFEWYSSKYEINNEK